MIKLILSLLLGIGLLYTGFYGFHQAIVYMSHWTGFPQMLFSMSVCSVACYFMALPFIKKESEL